MRKKPPIGLIPKSINDQKRYHEVCEAITRYYNASLEIPIEWIEEYNELVLKVEMFKVDKPN